MNYPSRPFSQIQPPFDDQDERDDAVPPRRMFLAEPGWRISVKTGNDREFCYMRAPGQDYYHRLLDGEVFVHRDEERLCLSCAMRRGLVVHQPKRLREAIIPLPADAQTIPLELGWCGADPL
jgi:hypothetical protein